MENDFSREAIEEAFDQGSINAIKSFTLDTQDQSSLENGSRFNRKQAELSVDGAKIPVSLELLQRDDRTDKLSISFTGDIYKPLEFEFDSEGNLSKVSRKDKNGEYTELNLGETKDILSKLALPQIIPSPLE